MLTPPTTPSPSSNNISVLVTGGVGFLGSFIVDAALEQHAEWEISVLDQNLPSAPKPRVIYEVGDVTDAASVDAIVNKISPDVIIHAAGLVPELSV